MINLCDSVSVAARIKIDLLFPPEERVNAERILIDQLNPGLKHIKAGSLDRWHFAALKVSEGTIAKLQNAAALGRNDRRELLAAANFGSADAYRSWQPGE